jgi:hypothetical protein
VKRHALDAAIKSDCRADPKCAASKRALPPPNACLKGL